jgi:thiol-disulfide isomerase/thioredoxin
VVASSCSSAPESGKFAREEVGNDGFLARHNGQIFAEGRSFSGNERDKLFLNDGRGSFLDLSDLSGADSPNDGRAVIAFDADDDGDVDLFVHETQRERHALYRNDLGTAPGFVKIQLRATTGNAEAIGALVEVVAGERRVSQVLSRGAGFISCQAPELVFGLGGAPTATVTVRWPGGAVEAFGNLAAGTRSLLIEGTGSAQAYDAAPRTLADPKPRGLLVNVGDRIAPFEVLDASGEPVLIDPSATGGRVALNLWASYCAPCVAELPLLEEWDAAEDMRVIAVSVDAPSDQARALELLGERAPGLGAHLTGAAADGTRTIQDVVDLARLPLPTTLMLSADGTVEEILRGPVEPR